MRDGIFLFSHELARNKYNEVSNCRFLGIFLDPLLIKALAVQNRMIVLLRSIYNFCLYYYNKLV